MIRRIVRLFAVRGYALRLAPALLRAFGGKDGFTIEQVTALARKEGLSLRFLAYAHAMFCSRSEFDAWYGPLKVACTYDGLRLEVARRYFGGDSSFDMAGLLRLSQRKSEGTFYESGIGVVGTGGDAFHP